LVDDECRQGREFAVPAGHCRGKNEHQDKKRKFHVQKTAGLSNADVVGCDPRLSPTNKCERGRHGKQSDAGEGYELRPKERVVRIVGPALGRKNRPEEADDDDRACENPIPQVD